MPAAPAIDDGGMPVRHYTVTASSGQTATTTDARTFLTINGLTNGRSVTFTVTASNAFGTSPASAPSNAVTPTAPAPPRRPTPHPRCESRGSRASSS